jgi:predicted dehydrogenase
VPREGSFSSTPWRQRIEYRGGPHLDGGVHQIAQIRLLCGDVARVHGEAQHANATMDGPSDLILNLRFVSGAIGNFTAAYPDIPVPSDGNEMRLYGTEAVMLVQKGRVSVHRPAGTVEEWRVERADGGYYNEFLNFYDAVVHGDPLIGTIAQNFHNLLIVLRGLDSAEAARVLEIDEAPGGLSATGVPLWRPRGADGLFDGLPSRVEREERQA